MTIRQTAARLGAATSAAAVVLAGAAIWLALSDPVAVASAARDGDVAALGLAILKLLGRGLARLIVGR